MLNRLITGFIFLSLSFVCFAIEKVTTVSPNNKNTNNTYSEDKLNISVTSDQPEFNIKLKSNATTGYAWFLREYNKDLIIPTKHRYQASDSKLMGAPGYEVWTFKAKPAAFIVPQQTTIRFIYSRPWQSENTNQVVFRVVTIKK